MWKRERLVLGPVELTGEDFSNLSVEFLSIQRSRLTRCTFAGARLGQASFGAGKGTSEYVECSFDRASIRASAPGAARFVNCSFSDCLIQEFFGLQTEFIDCVFSGTIKKAVFDARVPQQPQAWLNRMTNEFRGNDFHRAALLDVAFRGGIDLTQQRLPTGPDYLCLPDPEAALYNARRTIEGWTALEERRLSLALLQIFETSVMDGQQQLFVSKRGVPRSMKKIARVLFSMLEE